MRIAPGPAALAFLAFPLVGAPTLAQTALDRVDPSRIERREARDPEPVAGETVVTEHPEKLPVVERKGDILVGAIRVAGLKALSQSDFSDIIDRHLGRALSGNELSDLAEQLAARARARGYVLASARIAPQPLTTGILEVELDEGAIDEVSVEGVTNSAVQAALAPLASGSPVTLDQLERRLLIAGDIGGVTIGRSQVVEREGCRVLVVEATQRQANGWLWIGNDGTRPLGPVTASATIDLNGIAASADTLRLTLYDTILEPEELLFARARYAARLSSAGTELAATGSWSRSRPGAHLEDEAIVGTSWFGSLGVAQPLLRRRSASIWLNASFDVRDVRQQRRGAEVRHDRLSVVRAGLYAHRKLLGGWLRSNIVVSRGMDLVNPTEAGDPLASRFDADGQFTSASAWLDWTSRRYGALSFNLAGFTQLASGPLLLSEELGLGGGSFLRAYDYSERSGDRGAMASLEVRYEVEDAFGNDRGLQAYVFADAGRVSNFASGFGSGTLASAGGGVRAGVRPFTDLSAEIAVPLAGARYDSGDKDPRIRLSISRRF